MESLVIEMIGYTGTFFNAIGSIPQLMKTIKTKDVNGISLAFLIYWALGCGSLMIYCDLIGTLTWPLGINYGFNILVPSVLMYYYFKYRKPRK